MKVNLPQASVWSGHLEKLNSLEDIHPYLSIQDNQIKLSSQENIRQNQTIKLSLLKIAQISQEIFNSCSLQIKEQIVNGLDRFFNRRQVKYEALSPICQFIAWFFGYDNETAQIAQIKETLKLQYNRAFALHIENSLKEKAEQLAEQKRQEKYKLDELQKQALIEFATKFEDSSFDLATLDLSQFNTYEPEALEKCVRPLLEKEALLSHVEKRMTLYLLCEKTAERYLNDHSYSSESCQRALQIRLLMIEKIPCATEWIDIYSHIKSHTHPVFGCKMYPFGTTALKNHCLHVKIQKLENSEQKYLHIEARLNHYARKKLENLLKIIACQPKMFSNFFILRKEINDWIIEFKGVGSVKINTNQNKYCFYNDVYIDLEPCVEKESMGLRLYSMLALLGIGELVHPTRAIDHERIKIYQIFRAYYPEGAHSLEREQDAFEMDIFQLKERIIKLIEPYEKGMENLFRLYLTPSNKMMYQQTVYPDFKIWALQDYSEKLRKSGAVGLMTGVGTLRVEKRGVVYEAFSLSAQSVAHMLKLGVLSSKDRFQNGIKKSGISSQADLTSGGGDSVFCRIMIKKWLSSSEKKGYSIKNISFSGNIQILFDLSLLDRIGYGSDYDNYGAKHSCTIFSNAGCSHIDSNYHHRESLINLTHSLHKSNNRNHEICIKHRIPPEYICGLQVRSENHKEALIKILKQESVIQEETNNINGVLVDQFIHVGATFQEMAWPNSRSEKFVT